MFESFLGRGLARQIDYPNTISTFVALSRRDGHRWRRTAPIGGRPAEHSVRARWCVNLRLSIRRVASARLIRWAISASAIWPSTCSSLSTRTGIVGEGRNFGAPSPPTLALRRSRSEARLSQGRAGMGTHALAHGEGGPRHRGVGQDPGRRLAARHEPSNEGGLSQGHTAGASGSGLHCATQAEVGDSPPTGGPLWNESSTVPDTFRRRLKRSSCPRLPCLVPATSTPAGRNGTYIRLGCAPDSPGVLAPLPRRVPPGPPRSPLVRATGPTR